MFQPTDEQQKILDIRRGTHLVLAPPGSGKTELLAHRVFNAKNDGYSDSEIICLTFTNRAAKGMNDRIAEKYPNNKIIIGNIHHFCSKFLFQNKLVSLNTSILDEEEADQLIEELKTEFQYDVKVYNPELIKLATYLKQKEFGFSEELFIKPSEADIPYVWSAKELCEAYNKEKQENNYLDFDDLLTLTYYHLTHNEGREFLLDKFKWLQVDEVQDLNPLQWAIINEITATKDALVVYFGDYEQAIFSFMGAKLDSLHKLEKTIKSNHQNGIHNLLKNFRSPSYLLEIYIKYAETHLTPSWKKPPYSNIKMDAPKNALNIFKVVGDIYQEAYCISKEILPPLLNGEDKTAIIVRFNKSADVISQSLNKNNIPHFKISGFDIFRRKTVKGLMAFFSIIQNEYDRLSWGRLFFEFNIFTTLKQSRAFINDLNLKGLTPIDILKYDANSSRLVEFFDIFENKEMVVFDTETTGLDTQKDDIIQIAAIKISNGEVKEIFEVYINTTKDITESEKIHHISKEKLDKDGTSHSKGLMDFLNFCGRDAVLVAHNIAYDYDILFHNVDKYCKESLKDYCSEKFDTITIARLLYPSLSSYKLKDLIHFLKVEGENSHNALDDVKATVSLIKRLNDKFSYTTRSEQKDFLSDVKNALILQKFIERFNTPYSFIQAQLSSNFTLRQVAEYYFDYHKEVFSPKNNEEELKNWLEEWNDEMREVDKLLKHFSFYTENNHSEILSKKIDRYIPEYKMFKESDLYLGTEKVVVSTVYKAKGLEFDNVIVAETTDETYPYLYPIKKQIADRQRCKVYQINWRDITLEEKSLLNKQNVEDARAFYVAMTRSKKRLIITYHKRNKLGHSIYSSLFLECIKAYFIHH